MLCSVIVLLCNTGSASLFMAGTTTVWSRGTSLWAFQVALVAQNLPADAGDVKRCRFDPWVQEDPLEEDMATHSSVLAWMPHGQRSPKGYSPFGHNDLNMIEAT